MVKNTFAPALATFEKEDTGGPESAPLVLAVIEAANADDLRRVVDEYGLDLMPLPMEARALAEVYDRPGSEILVSVPMWTAEEGESDLELQVSCHKDASESWICVIEDLLVPWCG